MCAQQNIRGICALHKKKVVPCHFTGPGVILGKSFSAVNLEIVPVVLRISGAVGDQKNPGRFEKILD